MRQGQAASKPENRDEIYDWLRGFAAIAVVLGHFRPFGAPRVWFAWAVTGFILVTAALMSRAVLTPGKLFKRLIYVAFIYTGLILLFYPIFRLTGQAPNVPLWRLFLDPYMVFIENPYLDHTWYIAIHVQILLFVFLFQNQIRRQSASTVYFFALVISTVFFFFTRFVIKELNTLMLPSWFFVLAFGWYSLAPALEWVKTHDKHRGLRTAASAAVLAVLMAQPKAGLLLENADNKAFILNSVFYIAIVLNLADVYFLIEKNPAFYRLRQSVFDISRVTLFIYLYHQAVWMIDPVKTWNKTLVSLFCLVTGTLLGHLFHQIFCAAEDWVLESKRKSKEPWALKKKEALQ